LSVIAAACIAVRVPVFCAQRADCGWRLRVAPGAQVCDVPRMQSAQELQRSAGRTNGTLTFRVALALACVSVACQSAVTPTETLVEIDADSKLRELALTLHAHVESVSDHSVPFDKEWPPTWPVRLAMVPLDDHAEREFQLTVEAKDATHAVLVSARLLTGYVQDSKRYAALFLSAACLQHTPLCDKDSTCRAGTCVSAKLDPAALATTPCVTPGSTASQLCIQARAAGTDDDAGSPDAGREPKTCLPCPSPPHGSGVCDAGSCQVNCEPGYLECDGQCVDIMTDSQHCGGCGSAFACGSDRVCQGGHCVSCTENAACTVSECRTGVTHCQPAVMCVDTGPVSDGASCGNGASCQAGRCTCGKSNGSGATFSACSRDADCSPGHACVDEHGNGHFMCRLLCERPDDCATISAIDPAVHCSAAVCSNGRNPGIRVCVSSEDSQLAPSYESSPCCGGGGSSTVPAPGCADSTREAFTNTAKFPSVAGCRAKWPLSSMRAPATGHACGDALSGMCSVPADACAPDWHVCGAPPYGPTDISNKMTFDQCDAQIGAFAMALGDRTCECGDLQYGAACCGDGCSKSGGDCVFPGHTAWFGTIYSDWHTALCNSAQASVPGQGVLCCRGFPAP
jgi:hypothetical protein